MTSTASLEGRVVPMVYRETAFLEEKWWGFCHFLCISEEISAWFYAISWSECCDTTPNKGKT